MEEGIRLLRARLKLTQSGLAGLLQVSSHAVISAWENDRAAPSRQTLLLIRAAVEVPGFRAWLAKQDRIGPEDQGGPRKREVTVAEELAEGVAEELAEEMLAFVKSGERSRVLQVDLVARFGGRPGAEQADKILTDSGRLKKKDYSGQWWIIAT